tara:strand:+ start:313 stop:516 length:204 start_codon:yes stop_codon:yes gene_type:complete
MEELKIQIEIEQQRREDIENAIHDKFQFRYPSHFEFVAMAEDIQKLKELNTVIKVLEETLSAFLSNK